MLTFIPGVLWSDVRPHSSALLRSLGGVLDNTQAVSIRNPVQGIQVRASAKKVDCHDGLGSGGDGGFQDFGGCVVGLRITLHQDRRGALIEHGVCR